MTESKLTEENLKPCPFCGSDNIRAVEQPASEGEPFVWHICDNCKCETSAYDGYAKAIAAWNRRAGEQAARTEGRAEGSAERERLRAALSDIVSHLDIERETFVLRGPAFVVRQAEGARAIARAALGHRISPEALEAMGAKQ